MSGLLGAVAVTLLGGAPAASADEWLPHPAGATWQYRWSDSEYNPSGTTENVVVLTQKGISFTLGWADAAHHPPAVGSSSLQCPTDADIGAMRFQDTGTGLVNTDWFSCPQPSNYPSSFLCTTGTPQSQCADFLDSVLFNVIWGARNPVLAEPLLQGETWNATGGAANNVSSSSQYVGEQVVKVPAFPSGVLATAIRTNVALAGTPGDTYGSGVRTTWWVHGVGPVRVVFDHVDGSTTRADLTATSLRPVPPPPNQNYFPLRLGLTGTYRWTNSKHLTHPEVERVMVDAVAGSSARLSVKSVSGLIKTAGQYGFSVSLTGMTNIWGATSSQSLAKFPTLGHGRHFFTPIDLMTYGFNPVLPTYPRTGETWRSGNPRDLQVYGVTGSTRILGVRRVHVPAGTFNALVLRSTLTQRGHRFGSGVRTMWFAAGRGLVKLVFRHGDKSTSVVELIR